jgi:hypothetical protein
MMRTAALALLVGGLACGTSAQRLGKKTTRGIVDEIELRKLQDPSVPGPGAERVGRGVVKGVIEQLDTPELREQLASILQDGSVSIVEGLLVEAARRERVGAIALISDQVGYGMASAFTRALTPSGNGSLARNLSTIAEQVSASTVRGFRAEVGMFEDCRGPNRDECIDQRLTKLSKALTLGMRDGMRGMVELPLLALTFVLGVVVAMAFAWARGRGRSAHTSA